MTPIVAIVLVLLMVLALAPAVLAQVDAPGDPSLISPEPSGDSEGVGLTWLLAALAVGIVVGFGLAVGIRERSSGATQSRNLGRSEEVEEHLEKQREIVNRW